MAEKNNTEVKKKTPASTNGVVIADRGARKGIAALENSNKNWRLMCIVLAVVAIFTSTNFVFGLLGMKPKLYVQSSSGETLRLEELPRIPITDTRLASFADEASKSILALNFSVLNDQLQSARKYFDQISYDNVLKQLKDSNYIRNVVENNMIVAMTALPDFFQTNKRLATLKDGSTVARVRRAYSMQEQSGTSVATRYAIVTLDVQNTNDYEFNTWGLFVRKFEVRFYSPLDFEKMKKDERRNNNG